MKFSSLSNEVLSEILSFLCLKALIDPVSVVDRRFYYLAANLVANRKKGIEPHEITSLIIYFGLHDASQVSSGLRRSSCLSVSSTSTMAVLGTSSIYAEKEMEESLIPELEPIPDWILGLSMTINCPNDRPPFAFLTPELMAFMEMCQPLMNRLGPEKCSLIFDIECLGDFFCANKTEQINTFLDHFPFNYSITLENIHTAENWAKILQTTDIESYVKQLINCENVRNRCYELNIWGCDDPDGQMNMLTRDLAIDWLQSPLKSLPNRSDENPDRLLETETAENCTMKRALQSIRTFFYANYQLKDSDVDPRNPDKKRMSILSFLATLIEEFTNATAICSYQVTLLYSSADSIPIHPTLIANSLGEQLRVDYVEEVFPSTNKLVVLRHANANIIANFLAKELKVAEEEIKNFSADESSPLIDPAFIIRFGRVFKHRSL